MIGLVFWALLGLWLWVAFKLSRWVAARAAPVRWRTPVTALAFVALHVLLLADEIVAGFQFRALCAKNAVLVLNVDAASLKGKTIRSAADPSNKDVAGTPVRIYYSHFSYRDVENDKELLNYTEYYAEGGWLIRTLSFSSGIAPLTFQATCSPLPQTGFGFKFAKNTQ